MHHEDREVAQNIVRVLGEIPKKLALCWLEIKVPNHAQKESDVLRLTFISVPDSF